MDFRFRLDASEVSALESIKCVIFIHKPKLQNLFYRVVFTDLSDIKIAITDLSDVRIAINVQNFMLSQRNQELSNP